MGSTRRGPLAEVGHVATTTRILWAGTKVLRVAIWEVETLRGEPGAGGGTCHPALDGGKWRRIFIPTMNLCLEPVDGVRKITVSVKTRSPKLMDAVKNPIVGSGPPFAAVSL